MDYTFYDVENTASYGCLNNCVYIQDGTDLKFCFQTGEQKVHCTGKQHLHQYSHEVISYHHLQIHSKDYKSN